MAAPQEGARPLVRESSRRLSGTTIKRIGPGDSCPQSRPLHGSTRDPSELDGKGHLFGPCDGGHRPDLDGCGLVARNRAEPDEKER